MLPSSLLRGWTAGEAVSGEPTALVFATAGSKGLIRVWSTDKPRPLHILKPLAGSHDTGDGADAKEGEELTSSYTGLHYSESLRQIVGVTYDHTIIFLDAERLQTVKQVGLSVDHAPCSSPSPPPDYWSKLHQEFRFNHEHFTLYHVSHALF